VDLINDVLLIKNLMEHLELVVMQHHRKKAKVERAVQKVLFVSRETASNICSGSIFS
jgi:hypothetical protein